MVQPFYSGGDRRSWTIRFRKPARIKRAIKGVFMYRAGFLAVGLYMVLSGSGLLFVDDVALNKRISSNASPVLHLVGNSDEGGRCHLQPPEWIPYTCIGVGFVTMLYSVALPKD